MVNQVKGGMFIFVVVTLFLNSHSILAQDQEPDQTIPQMKTRILPNLLTLQQLVFRVLIKDSTYLQYLE